MRISYHKKCIIKKCIQEQSIGGFNQQQISTKITIMITDWTNHSSKVDQTFMGTMFIIKMDIIRIWIVIVEEAMERWGIDQFQLPNPGKIQTALADIKMKDMWQIEELMKTNSLMIRIEEGISMRILIGIQTNSQDYHKMKGINLIGNSIKEEPILLLIRNKKNQTIGRPQNLLQSKTN